MIQRMEQTEPKSTQREEEQLMFITPEALRKSFEYCRQDTEYP